MISNIKPNYTCPRCNYQTKLKGDIRRHLYGVKKECPELNNPIELTDEIKQFIIKNRVYKIPLNEKRGDYCVAIEQTNIDNENGNHHQAFNQVNLTSVLGQNENYENIDFDQQVQEMEYADITTEENYDILDEIVEESIAIESIENTLSKINQSIAKENNIIEEKTKLSRKSIPKALREEIWLTYIGEIFKAKCFCCERNYISPFNYHCGHIVAHSKGGFTTVQNLRPICIGCNLSMGTENLLEFKSRLRSS